MRVAVQDNGATAASGALSTASQRISHDDWLARVAEKKRVEVDAKTRADEETKAVELALKAASADQFESWKKRKGTLDVAV